MTQLTKARVFMSGRSQAIRIPAQFRFSTEEVFVRRDPQNGDLILSQAPGCWNELFAALGQRAEGRIHSHVRERIPTLPLQQYRCALRPA